MLGPKYGFAPSILGSCCAILRSCTVTVLSNISHYGGTSNKGPSEIGTKLLAPKCPLFRGSTLLLFPRLLVEKARCLGVPPGPLYSRLKQGATVTTPSGREVSSAEVVGPPRPGRRVVILGDTADSSQISRLARDADVIVHEATNEGAHMEKARANGHSTPGEVDPLN